MNGNNGEMESGPVICQRCGRTFANFVIEEIRGFAQLRCGDLLITRQDANCLHCGWTFHWNIREKAIEDMTKAYNELSQELQKRMYKPE